MSGSQKNTEVTDLKNGIPNPENKRDAPVWDEAQIHSYLPEFCSMEVHAPQQDFFASLDPQFFESTGEPTASDRGAAPASAWTLNDSKTETSGDRAAEDFSENLEQEAASATRPDEAASGSGSNELVPAVWSRDFEDRAGEDLEAEPAVSPESAAISWNGVDDAPTVTAGTTQCLGEDTGSDDLSPDVTAREPAKEDESSRNSVDSGLRNPPTIVEEKPAAYFEPVFESTDAAADAPVRLSDPFVSTEAENAGAPDPFEYEAPMAASSEAENADAEEPAVETPPSSTSTATMDDDAALPAEEFAETAENTEADSAPLELTEAVAEDEPAAAEDAESAPLELTDAVESASQTESTGVGLKEHDADYKAGLRALFAGAVRATKEKDFPTAITCLERFVSKSPNDPRGHYHLAVLRCRVGQYPSARDAAERAAALGAQGTGKLLKKIARKSAAQRPVSPGAQSGRTAETAVVAESSTAAGQPAAVEPSTADRQNAPEADIAQAPAEGISAEELLSKAETADANRGASPPAVDRRPEPQTEEPASMPAAKRGAPAGGKTPTGAAAAAPHDAHQENAANPEPSLKELYARGMEATSRKDYEAAVAEFEKFISRSPEPARGYYNLAILHYRLQDRSAARSYAERAVQGGVAAAKKILAKVEPGRQPSEMSVEDAEAATAAGPADDPIAGEEKPNAGEGGKSDNPTQSAAAAAVEEPPKVSAAGPTGERSEAEAAPNRDDPPRPDAADAGRLADAADEAAPSPEQINAWFSQGIQASQRKNYRSAVAHFEQFVAARPKEPKGHFNLAILYYRLQEYAPAQKHAAIALELGAEAASAILRKIERKTAAKAGEGIQSGGSNPADTALESTTEESTEDLAGRFLQEIQQTPTALAVAEAPANSAVFSTSTETEPDRLAAHIDTGEPEKTAETANGAVSSDAAQMPSEGAVEPTEPAVQPSKPADKSGGALPKASTPDVSEGLFARGLKASRGKDYATAIQCFERFVSQKPNEPRGHYNLAILHYRRQDYALARTYAENTLALGLKSAADILASIDAKEAKTPAASPTKPPATPAAPVADENPNSNSSSENASASGNLKLFDVEELDTEDFDTSAFIKHEAVVWDADEMEEAFDNAPPAAPVEENEYSFDDDVIVFDSNKETADVPPSEPAASRKTDARAAAPLSGGSDPKPGNATGNGAEPPPEPAPAPPGSGDEEETDRNFRLGKDAVGRKDYLQAVEHFTRVAELNPDDPRAFFQLAVISFRMKYFETSREHAERALDLGYPPARQLLETIQERAQAAS